MKKTILFIFILYSSTLLAQNNPDIKRTMHWFFGQKAGLDFTTFPPVADTIANDSLSLCTFSMSDTCGNLLFYGGMEAASPSRFLIFNRNHHLMTNGELITNCGGVSYPIVCPQPGNDSIFYIFYSDFSGYQMGIFYYAIININKNNGLGEVISKNEIILLDSLARWRPAATHHCNGRDIWVVSKMAHKVNVDNLQPSKKIYAWLLDENGLNLTPITSEVVIKPFESMGILKFSPDGSKAAATYYNYDVQMPDSSWVELYKFDNCTGLFSNPILIAPLPLPSGLCFSPDNSKLYVGSDFVIMYWHPGKELFAQYDISNWNQDSIIASKTIINTGPIYNTFQIGADGRIYVFDMDTTVSPIYWGGEKIGVITEPNLKGVLCNYIPEHIDLLGAIHDAEYIPFIESYFRSFEFVECNTNINENGSLYKNPIFIYPNPANDYLMIGGAEYSVYSSKIYDIFGNLLDERKIKKDDKIDISSLSSGIYLIQIYVSNFKFINFKFIKL